MVNMVIVTPYMFKLVGPSGCDMIESFIHFANIYSGKEGLEKELFCL